MQRKTFFAKCGSPFSNDRFSGVSPMRSVSVLSRAGWLRAGAVALLFLCFCGMYCLTVPELDVFLFAQDYGASASLLADACRYGNGRLLGNWFGFFFSLRYAYAFLLMAGSMTAVTLLLNRIFFDGSLKTLFLPAVVLAFPSAKMVQEVYSAFAAFTNYVLPVVFFLLNVRLLQALTCRALRPYRRAIALAGLFLSAAAASLFSENTTIVLFIFALLVPVWERMRGRRVSVQAITHLTGTILGGVCMILLPLLTHSAEKMDGYRGTVFGSVGTLVKGVFGGVLRTCGILNTFTLAFALLSLAFLLRMRGAPDTRPVRAARAVLAFFPLLSLFFAFSDLTTSFSRSVHLLQTLPTALYAAAICVGVFCGDKTERRRDIGMLLLLLSSIGPMLFVSTYGYRTYYITWVLLLMWAFAVLRGQKETLRAELARMKLSCKPLAVSLACVFVVCAGVYAMQSAINFDVYALRAEQIGQAIAEGETEITVPMLPCRYLSGEDIWTYSVPMVRPHNRGIRVYLTAEYRDCRDKDAYIQFARKSPVHVLRYALRHRQYIDPLVLERQLETEKMSK